MPFYEYECSNCRYYVEVLQKISDAPLRKCPSCGKASLKKLISAPVFRLKGSGWYETDFKTDKEHKRNLAGGEREAANDSAGTAAVAKDIKSDATPASGAAAEPAKAAPAASSAAAAKQSGTSGASGAAQTGSRRLRASIRGKAAAKRPAAPGRPAKRATSARRPGKR
jgi:putative FmdB family regulatory protein